MVFFVCCVGVQNWFIVSMQGETCLILPCRYKLILNTYLSGGEILR